MAATPPKLSPIQVHLLRFLANETSMNKKPKSFKNS